MKSRYANCDCAYRCPYRKICKIIIRVSQQEIQDKSKKKGLKEGNLNNLENNEKLVAALIKKNLNNPLSYHLDLIYKAKIPHKKKTNKKNIIKVKK